MKFYIYFLAVSAFFASCSGTRKLAGVDIKNKEDKASDTVEYELIIFDTGFDTWYVSHSKPTWYHSQDYYETWNKQYVTFWNSKAMSPNLYKFFDTVIDYNPGIDYGLELNHKLFYYFQYVEKALKIDILPPGMGPRSVF